MKKLFAILILVAFGSLAFGQGSAPLSKGDNQLNFGAGFGGGFPIYVGMDFAVHNDITVGPEVGFNLDGMDYMTIAGRGDYHWNRLLEITPDFDFYTGLNIGFLVGFSEYGGTSGLDLGGQVGGRWYWNDKWAINAEFAGGKISVGGKVGVSMKL